MNRIQINIALLLAFCTSTTLYAAPKPIAFNINGNNFTNILKLEEIYDNNIFFSDTDQTGSFVTIVSPSLSFDTQKGASAYQLKGAIQAGDYASSRIDNYIDAQISGDIHQSFSRRSQLGLTVKYDRSREARGTGFSRGQARSLSKPDKYHVLSASSVFDYGSRNATGHFQLSAGGLLRLYDNNLSSTRDREFITANFGTAFVYQVKPKTSLIVEFKRTKIEYILRSATLDSTESRYFVGADWDISNLTHGSLRFGLLQKDFETGKRDGFSGFSWEIGGNWSPLSYSYFTFQTRGKTEETNGVGDFIDSKLATASWIHLWAGQINTHMTLLIVKNTFNPTSQAEGIVSASAAVNYDMRRWLTISLEIKRSERLSNQIGLDYIKNRLNLGLVATL